ncbi:HNH endonuclease [Nocardioides silvaticus]|uniref:HNH endonuclease n=1 Tax=Nocardioides silvaticus TaxID=2201891 RepID=A0A316TJV6_9ACTN|nr:HNH endonuclease family protein [Nocardioides silvaticus]PWN02542.1 HNH endonuclease [Nocardioides silvaticus]
MKKLVPSIMAAVSAVAATLLVAAGPAPSAHAAGETYSAPLTTAIGSLTVAAEVRTGYERSKFKHWVDADGDGCSTRFEVLDVESETSVTCSNLAGGRWFSYYDRVSWTDAGRIDIDHMVPLAEAWDSGARSWTAGQREAYANDLGDHRTLVGVTDSVNQAKGDQDVAQWLPTHDKCRYLREWVAVKIRWRLSVNSAEKTALQNLAAGCTNVTITVTRAI